jgi:endogenous inhibitor of DNA gyrase (YacG/DUF329 family)
MSQTKVNCPTCNTQVIWAAASEYRPFCSKRCQLIDLGEWANESHTITDKTGFTGADLPADIEDIEAMLQQQEQDFFKE